MNLSIKKKMLILFFVLIFTFSATVSILVLQVVTKELKQRTIKMEIQRAQTTMTSIENYLLQIKNTAISILSDVNVEDLLESEETDVTYLLNHFQAIMSTNSDNVFSIFIYDINEDNLLATSYDTTLEEIMSLLEEKAGSGSFYLIKDNYNNSDLLVYPCVLKKNFFNEEVAYISINAHLYYMKSQVVPTSYSENSFQFLLNEDNQIVFGSDYKDTDTIGRDILILPFYSEEQYDSDSLTDVEYWEERGSVSLEAAKNDGFDLVGVTSNDEENYTTALVDGVKYLVLYTQSSEYGWTHVQYIPEKEIFSSVRTITYILLGTTFLFTIIAFILAYIFSAQITRPIFKLTNMMENYKLGKKIDNSQMIVSNNEFGYLFESYKDMVRRTEYLIDENFRMELSRKQMELKMVKSAIDPHFMYNILDSVHWLIKLGETKKAMEVLHDFPRYLRNMLHNQEDFISVKSERETIDNYCRLQKFFYNEKINHEIDIPESIENYSIMPLLLQPIVENAYKHAFKESSDCIVKIAGRLVDNVLEFSVSDNGVGIVSERLNEITEKIRQFELDDEGKFFGLGSSDKRIKIQYGDKYGLEIKSIYKQGTTVILRYPVI